VSQDARTVGAELSISPLPFVEWLGRAEEARDAYRRALELVHVDAERRLLEPAARSARRG